MGRRTYHFDWITTLILLCIGLLGLFVLLTISTGYFWQQLLFLVIGFALMIGFSFIDAAILWWFAPIGYVLSNIFLALSYLGPSIRGATRWIIIGGAQVQPSEMVKPFLLLAFAYFMTRWSPRKLKNIPILFALFVLPFILVMKQPDLGSSIVYAAMWGTMLVAGGLSVAVIIIGGIVGTLLLPFGWNHLHAYQQSRILTFLNPGLDPKGAGYNALQAMIAVGSGQLWGRGLGMGTQSHLRFLPEYHTDFIFATLIEELGFIGGLLLFGAYAGLLYRVIMPFIRQGVEDTRLFMYSFGLFAMLLAQIFINAGMNMGLIPITGITLPFVSYGGSSILSTVMAFGILASITRGKQTGDPIAIIHHS